MDIVGKNKLLKLAETVAIKSEQIVPYNIDIKSSSKEIKEKCRRGECWLIGKGRTRAVFDLGNGTVAKFLTKKSVDMSKKNFLELNETEYKHYIKYGNFLPLAKCINYEENGHMLIMEKTIPVRNFLQNFKNMCPKIAEKLNISKGDICVLDTIEDIIRHPGISMLFGFSKNIMKHIREKTNLRYNELMPLFNWGVNKNGRLVCIDYGEYKDMYYYKDSSPSYDMIDSLSDLSSWDSLCSSGYNDFYDSLNISSDNSDGSWY